MTRAGILTEVLPYIQSHAGQVMVIKYGGHAMGDIALAEGFARDVTLLRQLGVYPVIVHGGGPQIDAMLKRLSMETRSVAGLRVTDNAVMEVVEMVLAGTVNTGIVGNIMRAGGRAVGLTGADDGIIRVDGAVGRARVAESAERTGIPTHIRGELVAHLCMQGFIPVLAPLGVDELGRRYNVNADMAAGALASALKASRVMFLTDIEGVHNERGEILASLDAHQAEEMIAGGVLTGGMIPKVQTCLAAVREGVGAAVIVDGRRPHSVLLELFTDQGSGTLISSANASKKASAKTSNAKTDKTTRPHKDKRKE